MLIPRSDGKKLKGLGLTRRFLPIMMPRRNESVVYYEQKIDMEAMEAFLAEMRAEHGVGITFMHCVLYAVAKRIKERPYMNRFTKGPYAYQRDGIWLSFSAKKSMEDTGALRTVKRQINPEKSLLEIVAELTEDIHEVRTAEKTTTDKELSFFFRLPTIAFMLILKLSRFLDYFGLLPPVMIRTDPMYASMFVAHLGSVGMDAAFHHLYEYGTIPIFLVIGKTKEEVVARDGEIVIRRQATFRYSYDERIADGFYTASTLEVLKEMLENPREHLL